MVILAVLVFMVGTVGVTVEVALVAMAEKLGVIAVLPTVVVMSHQVLATAQVDSTVATQAMAIVQVDTTHMEDRKRGSAVHC